jgi:TRAP-type C4-dicarboxylate transport system permease small subunit
MNKLVNMIDGVLKWFLAALMASIVLVVCWQVLSRFVLNLPSSVTEELSRCLLIWIGMVGAAFAYRTGVHLGLDVLTQKLSGTAQLKFGLLVSISVVAFALVVMVVGGGNLVWLTFELNQISAALNIKMAYIYVAIPLSGALITFYGSCQFVALLSGQSLPDVKGMQ